MDWDGLNSPPTPTVELTKSFAVSCPARLNLPCNRQPATRTGVSAFSITFPMPVLMGFGMSVVVTFAKGLKMKRYNWLLIAKKTLLSGRKGSRFFGFDVSLRKASSLVSRKGTTFLELDRRDSIEGDREVVPAKQFTANKLKQNTCRILVFPFFVRERKGRLGLNMRIRLT